jgi:D-alanine-D-alanine ligase-like ATP-grasp enzyme
VLNDPVWSMRRYELLRTMHDRGVNSTNVYRVTENHEPQRYPVFVRGENDHSGSQTALLHSREELQAAIEDLARRGVAREQLLITEFCDTKDGEGVYRKYSVFYVRGEVIPRHAFFGTSWMLKSPELFDQAHLDEEYAYHMANPHAEELRAIFTAARIDYGRIDYGVENGAVRVWEINTNPMISTPADATCTSRVRVQERFAPAFNRALRALATNGSAAETICIPKLLDTRKRRPVWKQFLTLFRRAA